MIRINLIQQQAGPAAASQPSAQSGVAMVVVILLVALGISGGTFFHFYSSHAKETRRAEELRREYTALDAERRELAREYQELQEALAVLKRQDEILSVLDPENRLFWAKKLNILPLFVPEGVFLTRLEVKESVREEELPESRERFDRWTREGRRGTPPQRDMRPVITQTLDVDGLAYVPDGSNDQRLRLIIDFHNALSRREVAVPFDGEVVRFIDQMQPLIDFQPIEDTRLQNRDVTQFRFRLTSIQRARPQTPETRDAPARP